MPRLFTGLELPPALTFNLSLMKGGIAGARWIDREALHITLRFIGDISGSLAREIAYELEGIIAQPFDLRLQGIEVMGGNKPHTLYAGLAESSELRRLQAAHERVAQSLGLPAEQRRFIPHVALARLKDPDLQSLERYVLGHNPYSSDVFTVPRFVLFSSRPLRGGGPYAVEEAYDLQSPTLSAAGRGLHINQAPNIS